VRDIYGFRQTGVRDGVAVGEFHASGYAPSFLPRLVAGGVELPEEMFHERTLAVPGDPRRRDGIAGPDAPVEVIWASLPEEQP
jgi:hypothetical protein